MDGFTFQTHSVYRDRRSGALVLLVHHNPMALCSLLLDTDGSGFDAAHPRQVGVDTIIEMRRSGDFEELAPLPGKEFAALLNELAGHVSNEDKPFVRALIEQLPKE